MLLCHVVRYGWLLAISVQAQSTSKSTISSSKGISELTLPTGSYITYTSTITLASTTQTLHGIMTNGVSSMATSNMTSSSSTTTSASKTVLQGTNRPTTSATNRTNGTATGNSTALSTSLSPQPTNTTPCNGYPEFCNRKYSNITMVCAHNSPFNVPGNVASNQELPVLAQLNDGIRMLQVQTHYVNETLYLCHTSCSILNAGTLTSYLSIVTTWIQSHPYDIVTILIGNGDYNPASTFVSPIQDSGLSQYVYTPPKIPMSASDWPNLGSMILSGQRIVLFLDYEAKQMEIPWLIDEFGHIWETPFDPTDRTFPCTVQRPPGLSDRDAKERIYMMNHNLNQQVSLLGNDLLIPMIPLLPVTNNVSGAGSLGESAEDCFNVWGHAPTFLNVDYYNNGSGSVFAVAAKWNNVTYNHPCCGLVTSSAGKTASMTDIIGRSYLVAAGVIVLLVWGFS